MNKLKILLILLLLLTASCSLFRKTPEVSKQSEKDKFKFYFSEANSNILIEDYGKALLNIDECLKFNPESAASFYLKAQIYNTLGQTNQAILYSLKTIEYEPDNYWYKYFLARLYVKIYNYEKAIPLYEDVILYSKNSDHFRELAYYYKYTKQYNNVIHTYSRLQKLEGINTRNSFAKIQIYEIIDDQLAIEREIKSLINCYVDNIIFYRMLSSHYIENNNLDSAKKINQKLIFLHPKNGYAHLSMANYYKAVENYDSTFIHLSIAFSNSYLPKEDKLEFLLSDTSFFSIKNYPGNQVDSLYEILLNNHQYYTEAFYNYALYLNSINKQSQAIFYLNKFIKDKEIHFNALSLLSELYFNSYNYTVLDTLSKYALDLYPNQPKFYLYAGVSALGLFDFEYAEEILRTGLDFTFEDNLLSSNFNFYLSQLYRSLEDSFQQEKYYNTAIELAAQNYELLNSFASYFANFNFEIEKAVSLNNICLDYAPNNSNYLYIKALILYKQNSFTQAKINIENALKTMKFPKVQYLDLYGDILYKLGDQKAAFIQWTKATEIDNTNYKIKEKLNK